MKTKVIGLMGMVVFLFGSAAVVSAQGHSDIIQICTADSGQGYAQVAYDPNHDEYLVVWEDNRYGYDNTDVYGQFVDGDGTLIGINFPICTAVGDQWWPHLDFNPSLNNYLIVFEDNRNGNDQGDIRGAFIDSDGNFVDAPTSGADHTFGICTESHDNYTCSVAFNYVEDVYLVVWGDNRAEGNTQTGERWGVDIYGQLVSSDGALVSPSDPVVNFAIDQADWYGASVADVTYNDITNEFFVVYGMDMGYVLGQRVSHTGQLINPDGTTGVVAKPGSVASVLPAMLISQMFMNGPDCLQAKTASRTEYSPRVAKVSAVDYTEMQVIWKGQTEVTMQTTYNDVYGQRIGFFLEGQKYAAYYVNLDGDTTADVCNYPISIQNGWAGVPDLAYGVQDDEYLVGWGDPRKGGFVEDDLYVQRLWINDDDDQIFLADNRVDTTSYEENIPVDTTSNDEGSILGVAHSSVRNEFLLAYQFKDITLNRGVDVYGRIFYGSEPSTDVPLSNRGSHPGDFQISQNYPNPFNPETAIEFSLPVQSKVVVEIFDLLGRRIQTLFDEVEYPGTHRVSWNGKDESGIDVSSGVYFYQVRTEQFSAKKKMLLIR